MEVFATDLEKLAFLLEVDAELAVDEELHSQAAASGPDGPVSPEDRPKYITNYIGSKQKLVDWIWNNWLKFKSDNAEMFEQLDRDILKEHTILAEEWQ